MLTLTMQEPASWPDDGRAKGQRVGELFKAAQYEQVAELLRQAQIENEQMSDTALTSTLVATRQIFLALAASQAEINWYQQAYKVARERKYDLMGQLQAILGLIEKKGAGIMGQELIPLVAASIPNLGMSEPEILEPVVRHHLWESLPDLWGGKSNASAPLLEALTASLAQQIDSSTTLSTEPPISLTAPLMRPVKAPAAAFTKTAPRESSCGLVVCCLGSFRVYQNSQLVEKWNGYKCKLLFKYLVIHRQQPIHREVLMDLFWPEADPTAARKNLHQAIFNLRQTLQTGCPDVTHILLEDSCYYLNPELDVALDSEAFIGHYQKGRQLEGQGYLPQAIKEYELADNLYKGEFLAEDLYEDWTTVQREHLKQAYLDTLDRLSRFYFAQEQFAFCITFCQKILALDNCHEETHRRLMRCYQSQGQRHLALRQFHLCAETLERELAVLPAPATVELYRQIQGNYVEFPK